jgi:plastocyanin domain-containing protein
MLNRGFALTGIDPFGAISFAISPKSTSNLSQVSPILNDSGAGKLGDNSTNPKYQEITMYILSSGWNPDTFTVKKGIPVKWTITAKELTYCNKGIKAPKLGMSHTFDNVGDTFTFEFTPTEVGTIPFTCWMGMISGKIEVIE